MQTHLERLAALLSGAIAEAKMKNNSFATTSTGWQNPSFIKQVLLASASGKPMNKIKVGKNALRSVLIAAGLVAGFNLGMVSSAFADAALQLQNSDSMGTALSDTALTAKVKFRLMDERSLKKSDIAVTTTNGMVRLDGSASDLNAKAVAEKVSKSVAGVKAVDNQLIAPVSHVVSAETREAMVMTKEVASDSWITTKVKSEIVADSVSKGFVIKVETTNGMVTLTGNLANQRAIKHVKGIAEKVDGVKEVNTDDLVIATQ